MVSYFQRLGSALTAPIGNRQNSRAKDVIQTRRNFASLGLYSGDTELGLPDKNLDTTIRTFQKSKGLKVDGIMNPDGETERALKKTDSQIEQEISALSSQLSALQGDIETLRQLVEEPRARIDELDSEISTSLQPAVNEASGMVKSLQSALEKCQGEEDEGRESEEQE
ncbi:MAG: hypothetical protein CMH27_04555 [Micavibrio sp.]|nr:hypothetical protein [Micavibrio sp.]|tara:strand:- start:3028 stop:3531 length:504 start_codon:yes stop_codon:yes gene_type:complete